MVFATHRKELIRSRPSIDLNAPGLVEVDRGIIRTERASYHAGVLGSGGISRPDHEGKAPQYGLRA